MAMKVSSKQHRAVVDNHSAQQSLSQQNRTARHTDGWWQTGAKLLTVGLAASATLLGRSAEARKLTGLPQGNAGAGLLPSHFNRALLATPTLVPGATKFSIVNQQYNQCLDATTSANNVQVLSKTCSAAASQKWDMDSSGAVRVSGSNNCMTVSSSNLLTITPCIQSNQQKFNFASDGANFGPLKNQLSLVGVLVNTNGAVTVNGHDPTNPNQRFNGLGKQPDIWTQNVDNSRTGAYTAETQLTPATVTPNGFGRLAQVQVDGYIYARPLYLNAVPVGSAGSATTRNVLLIATMNNSLYAFDADNPSEKLWSVNFGTPVPTSVYGGGYSNIQGGKNGLLGTPVVNRVNSNLYVVAATQEGGNTYHHRLRFIDIRTGEQLSGDGLDITGSAAGTADPNSNGRVIFESLKHLQRSALTLANSQVLVPFGSHSDQQPYHGWIFSYQIQSLATGTPYCSTPNVQEGSVWQVGSGLAYDGTYVYASTGNGADGATTSDDAEKTLKFKFNGNSLSVVDYFQPYNWQQDDSHDLDYGNSGILLIPNTRLGVAADKGGTMYLLDLDNLGKTGNGNNNQIPQSWKLPGQIFQAPVFHENTLYVHPQSSHVVAYTFDGSKFNPNPAFQGGVQAVSGDSFGGIAVSGNGTGKIVWDYVTDAQKGPTLSALNGDNLATLWTSTGNSNDAVSVITKFNQPVIANGKVFAPTSGNTVSVYGLK